MSTNAIILFQQSNQLTADGKIGPKTAKKLVSHLKITSNVRGGHFLGQCSHESGKFTKTEEGLYYKDALRIAQIFRGPFDLDKDKVIDPEEIEFAKKYIGKPIDIANYAYANRMGNGNVVSGDGYKFRGRGPLQMTGRDNYQGFSDFIGEDCVSNPDLVITKYYFEAAIWYFNVNRLWEICDQGINDKAILTLSRAINLGNRNSKAIPHKLEERKSETIFFYNLLNN